MNTAENEHELIQAVLRSLPTSWRRVDTSGDDSRTLDILLRAPSLAIYGLLLKGGKGKMHFNTATTIEASLKQISQLQESRGARVVLILATSQEIGERLLASIASLRFFLVEYDSRSSTYSIASKLAETILKLEQDAGEREMLCEPASNFWLARSRGDQLVPLHNAAVAAIETDDFRTASRLLERILAKQSHILGKDNLNVMLAQVALAQLLVRAGDDQGAASLCEDVLANTVRGNKLSRSATDAIVSSIAEVLIESGSALTWREMLARQRSASVIARLAESLGRILFERGRTEEAEQAYQHALDAITLDSQDATPVMVKLGDLLVESGRLEEAEHLYRRILDQGSQGEPKAWLIATKLGDLLTQRGSVGEAEYVFRRALDVLDPDSREAGILTTALGTLLTDHGRYEDAEFLYRHALEMLDPDSREAAAIAMTLGTLLTDRNRFDDAEHLYRRTLDRATSGNPAIRHLAVRLAQLLVQRDRFGEAEFVYRRVLEMLDPGGVDSKEVTRKLVELLSRRGMTGEVERLHHRSSAGYPRLLHLSVEGPHAEGIAESLSDWLWREHSFSARSMERGWKYIGRAVHDDSTAIEVIVNTRLSLMHLITTIAQWRDSSPLHPTVTLAAGHSNIPSVRIASSEPHEVIDAIIGFV